MTTHLVTELGKLNVRLQGPATAGIWLATNDSQFPMAGWNDFVVVILSWWAAAILRLLRNESGVEWVHFMDGPYAVEVSKAHPGKLQLRMFAGPSGGREVAVGVAGVGQFIGELFTQSRRLLDECRLRGWWSLDAEELASRLQDLERQIEVAKSSVEG